MDYKPGDKIPVKVGDRLFETLIDEHGVQRFQTDRIMAAWVDGTTKASDEYNRTHMDFSKRDVKFYTLNDLVLDYYNGKFTKDEMLTFYTSIGYSISGFCDLSMFDDLEVLNPVWGDEL